MNYERHMDINVNGSVHVDGTLNDETDIDNGYCAELAVSWKEMGLSPVDIESMGLEIWTKR